MVVKLIRREGRIFVMRAKWDELYDKMFVEVATESLAEQFRELANCDNDEVGRASHSSPEFCR